MGHHIQFSGINHYFGDVISESQITDLIEMFFDCPDTGIIVRGEKEDEEKKSARGRHTYLGFGPFPHVITLYRSHINEGFAAHSSMGGNGIPSSLKVAVASVLVHEIRHAWQAINHYESSNKVFYKGKYAGRPCERDARTFVDSNMAVITQFMEGSSKPKVVVCEDRQNDLEEIIEMFLYLEEVNLEDIREELRRSSLNNPKSMETVLSALRMNDVKIER